MPTEIEIKQQRVADFCSRHGLDGVMLFHRNNFSWSTCGRVNRIVGASEAGVASILFRADGRRLCLTNTIESPRFRGEELTGTGIEVVDFPWYDPAKVKATVKDVIGNARIAADVDAWGVGLPPLPPEFAEVRFSLTPEEIERYQTLGRRASAAMEMACRELKAGLSEHDAASLLALHTHQQQLEPTVVLVASDHRIDRYRHPIAVDKVIDGRVMLVLCAEMGGLIVALTRIVAFKPPGDDLRRRHQACVNVDAAVNLATAPGKTLGQIFGVLAQAYAEQGYDGEWKLHHQGGPTGYAGREALATPTSQFVVRENQPFAWNPSITGTKSEDTVIVTSSGVLPITAPTPGWPTVNGEYQGNTLMRAGILEL